jgi:hypothetical protein
LVEEGPPERARLGEDLGRAVVAALEVADVAVRLADVHDGERRRHGVDAEEGLDLRERAVAVVPERLALEHEDAVPAEGGDVGLDEVVVAPARREGRRRRVSGGRRLGEGPRVERRAVAQILARHEQG